MRKGLFLLVGLLWGLTSFAQIASPTAFGVIKSGAGLYVDPVSGVMSVTGGTGSGGGTTTGPAAITVTNLTSTGVQNAIDQAVYGQKVICPGPIDCSFGTVLLQKGIILEGVNGCVFDGKSSNHVLLKINNCNNALIHYIKFASQHNGDLYGLILFNEEGPTTYTAIEDCEFTCPNGTYNAISAQAWNGSSGTFCSNIAVRRCFGHDLNRMFLEFTAHKWDGVPRYSHLYVEDCLVVNTGLVDLSNGMPYSFSGDIFNVFLVNCSGFDYRGYGAEFIGTRTFKAANCTFITTKRWGDGGNQYGSNGYNFTDGYNTENGNPGKGATNGDVLGGYVNVSGRPAQLSYATNIRFNDVNWYGGDFTLLQHGSNLTFRNPTITTGYQVDLFFDNTINSEIIGGTFSTVGANAPYENIGFYNGSTGNKVIGSNLYGTSGNGLYLKENDNTGSNTWRVMVNGQLQSQN